MQAVQKNLSQSRAEISPVDVESHSTLSSISHVTIENLTQFLSFLLNFNAASENPQELSLPWQNDTALRQAADGGNGLQMWWVAANIINKQWQTAKNG